MECCWVEMGRPEDCGRVEATWLAPEPRNRSHRVGTGPPAGLPPEHSVVPISLLFCCIER